MVHVILFSKQQSALGKYKGLLSDRDAKIQDLEGMLGKEKDESKKQLSLIEEEVRIRTNSRTRKKHIGLIEEGVEKINPIQDATRFPLKSL